MATDVLRLGLDTAGFQLEQCLNGMPEAAMDSHLPGGMSPREILEHLCECYEAYQASLEGREHEWGSFSVPDKATEPLLSAFREARGKAVARALASDDGQARDDAMHYIVLHDCYHVGQLCLIRLNADPSWDPYSIYREHVA